MIRLVLLIIGGIVGSVAAGAVGHGMKRHVHNLLTAAILAIVGVWIVTSTTNPLASGLIVGGNITLWWTFWRATDKDSWYWLWREVPGWLTHRVVSVVWGGLILIMLIGLVRG